MAYMVASMLALPLLLTLTLVAQTDPGAEGEPEPAVVAEPDAGVAALPPARANKAADEVAATLKKIQTMTDEERAAALLELQKKYGDLSASPVLPPAEVDLDRYTKLALADQAKVSARAFFNALLAANTAELVARSGFPFMLEDRRFERPEDLRNEWARSLRGKRTELLALHDIEVLTPAELEKKYGKPPARLNAWNWRNPGVWIAVGNLSGHATVIVLRQAGLAWQVVAFHD